MPIEELQLVNFRSYAKGVFKLDPKITIFTGPNGSGKTNLLESVYTLALTKSFRAKDHDLIKHGQNFFRISASRARTKIILAYGSKAAKRFKKISYNNTNYSIANYIGKLKVTLFEPGDLEIINGAPEKRRQFLDAILSQADTSYLKTLISYKRTIKQRNTLLLSGDSTKIKDQIFVWDLKLTERASEIYLKRNQLIKYFDQRTQDIYNQIARSKINLKLHYQPSVEGRDNYESAFIKTLTDKLSQDIATGFTTIGPHREDFNILFNNSPIESVASRGEIRTTALALKLAEVNYLAEVSEDKPTLLLDDVFSELDTSRRQFLIKQLKGYQTLITTTDIATIKQQLKKEFTEIKLGGKNHAG